MHVFMIFALRVWEHLVEAGVLAEGNEMKHGFNGDENYKDLTIQKQTRGKTAAVFNSQPTDY